MTKLVIAYGLTTTKPARLPPSKFVGLNGVPNHEANEAVSFMVVTEIQRKPIAVGRHRQQRRRGSTCAWCRDGWGSCWQITPRRLLDLMTSGDPAMSKRFFKAMMTMSKIDIVALEQPQRLSEATSFEFGWKARDERYPAATRRGSR